MKSLTQYINEVSSDKLKQAHNAQVERNGGKESNRSRRFAKGAHDALDKEMKRDSNNHSSSKSVNFIDMKKHKDDITDGFELKGKDGDYIVWWSLDKSKREVVFYPAKYIYGNGNWISQEDCEQLLGKSKGYLDDYKDY